MFWPAKNPATGEYTWPMAVFPKMGDIIPLWGVLPATRSCNCRHPRAENSPLEIAPTTIQRHAIHRKENSSTKLYNE